MTPYGAPSNPNHVPVAAGSFLFAGVEPELIVFSVKEARARLADPACPEHEAAALAGMLRDAESELAERVVQAVEIAERYGGPDPVDAAAGVSLDPDPCAGVRDDLATVRR